MDNTDSFGGDAMKFQTKMIVVYAVLGTLIACIAGSIYYSVSMSKLTEQENQKLRITARQLEQQYEEMIQSMKDVSQYLLSDRDTLSAITGISYMEDKVENDIYLAQAEKTIQVQISTDYITRKFYRVVFCNDRCLPIASNNWLDRQIINGIDYKEMPWYDRARENPDTFTIMGAHRDTWGKRDNPEVFSVIKQIQGKDMGYIEVQKTMDDVARVLQAADLGMDVCLMNSAGEILFQNREQDVEFNRQFLGIQDIQPGKYEDGQGNSCLAAGIYNKKTDTMILVLEDAGVLREGAGYIYVISLLLIGGGMLLSLGYVMIATKRLTKPMHRLQKAIQDTQLETLDQPLEFDDPNDEFQKMARVYEEMKLRLNRAILQEKRLSFLQLQAQFDMLQAQVNPHFLYNVLNVISNRGILSGDEVICDICDDLAGMLRYATDTKEKYATLEDETDFLKLYFSLLKYRYEHKLEYTINIDQEIERQILPKLVLQQLVENSIAHGFENSSKIMKICVTGWQEDGRWYVRVRDNGEGFKVQVMEDLEKSLEKIRKDLTTNRQHVEMKIGGMGLINTYARLYLLNADDLVFNIQNNEDGAQIVFGASLS